MQSFDSGAIICMEVHNTDVGDLWRYIVIETVKHFLFFVVEDEAIFSEHLRGGETWDIDQQVIWTQPIQMVLLPRGPDDVVNHLFYEVHVGFKLLLICMI